MFLLSRSHGDVLVLSFWKDWIDLIYLDPVQQSDFNDISHIIGVGWRRIG